MSLQNKHGVSAASNGSAAALARQELPIAELRSAVRGQVITPEDPEYDAARSVFYGGIDRRPGVIVRVADAADVARVVSIARESGVPLAVRGGGHSAAGFGVSDGGITISLSNLKGIEIDAEGRTAWAGTGLKAGEYMQAADAYGLTTGFGDSAEVGIGGLTLGGGVGFLVRKHGLTIDSLLAAEIVTADGQIRIVDASHDPDLFWAIRGGGGNFGVATRFKYRLHDVSQFVGGMLILPASPEVVLKFLDEAKQAPEELSAILNIMVAPPMPFLPQEAHGKLILMALIAYVGDAEAGQRAIAPFRALAEPLADMVRPMRYPEMYFPEEEGYHPLAAGRTFFIDALSEREAKLILDTLQSSSAQMAVTQIRVLGGAMARVPDDATAFAHRQRRMMANVAALYANVDEKPTHEAWAGEYMAALRQGQTGVYVNFLEDEGEARIREAYPGATWDRLREVKAKYDPDNLFRWNQNIPPK